MKSFSYPLPLAIPGGHGLVALNHPPHPNARKVMVNWLLSREGQGTLFRLTFPPGEAHDVEGPAPAEAVPLGVSLRCLVVDDEDQVGTVLGDILRHPGEAAAERVNLHAHLPRRALLAEVGVLLLDELEHADAHPATPGARQDAGLAPRGGDGLDCGGHAVPVVTRSVPTLRA